MGGLEAGPPDAREQILDRLERGPIVLDGAMGTRLLAAGLNLKDDDPALWNLSHPEAVAAIHDRDLASGAGAVVTNTFGANRCWLARFRRVGLVASINRRAVQLARGAAGPRRFVLGCLGPTTAHQRGTAAEQAGILASEGVDALLFETFRFPEAERAVAEVVDATRGSVPLFVSLWKWPHPPESAACRLIERGASVLGLNCQPGADAAIDFAARVARAVRVPLLVEPGIGAFPNQAMSPDALAAAVPRLLAENVRLIGGCCGTDERHISAVAGACSRFHRV
jgi:methionine synthase I (cobalamin-dependent)